MLCFPVCGTTQKLVLLTNGLAYFVFSLPFKKYISREAVRQTCFCRKSHCQSISVSSGWRVGVLGASLRLQRQSYINAQKRTARLAAIWRSSDWMKPKPTQLHWGEKRGGGGGRGRRGRRCCFMLLDLQCHNREMLAYYNHCEPKLRGFSNATLRLCWYEVFRLTCVRLVRAYLAPLLLLLLLLVLDWNRPAVVRLLTSPPLYLCQVHMTANSLNVPHGFTYLQAAASNFTPA